MSTGAIPVEYRVDPKSEYVLVDNLLTLVAQLLIDVDEREREEGGND